jgi:hypothetical protein
MRLPQVALNELPARVIGGVQGITVPKRRFLTGEGQRSTVTNISRLVHLFVPPFPAPTSELLFAACYIEIGGTPLSGPHFRTRF